MFTKQKRDELAEEYHKGNTDRVIEEVWKETDKQLRKGVMDGYGKTGYDVDDFDTVIQLNSNVGVFSAFKSYRVHQVMKTNLTDDNGKKLPFDKFLENYRKVDSEYNANYLRAEYNLSQRQAASANQWNDFQRSKDLYPNLKYMPSRSAEPRQDHTKYYGIIKPINDPIWNDLIPPLAWGCNCWVTNTDEPAVATTVEPPQPVDGIIGNAGKNQMVFSNSHPFVKGVPKEEKRQVATFLSKMKDKHLSDQYLGGKVGKGRVKVSLNADQKDFVTNVTSASMIAETHGKSISIRPHSNVKDVSNPEFEYRGSVGDRVQWDTAKDGKNFINTNFRNKYGTKNGKPNQLKGLDNTFLIFDFNGRKLKGRAFDDMMRRIPAQFKNHDSLNFFIIQNKGKSVLIERGFDYNTTFNKVKKELFS